MLLQVVVWLPVLLAILASRSAAGLKVSISNQESLQRVPSCRHSTASIEITNTVRYDSLVSSDIISTSSWWFYKHLSPFLMPSKKLQGSLDCLIWSIQLGPETTVPVEPSPVSGGTAEIVSVPRQFRDIHLEGGSLSLSPGEVVSVPLSLLPRFPPPPAARLGESWDAVPPNRSPSRHGDTSHRSSNLHLASADESASPALEEYRITSTLLVDTEMEGMHSIPIEATSVRQNAFGVPDSIYFHGTSSKPAKPANVPASEAPTHVTTPYADCYDLYVRHPGQKEIGLETADPWVVRSVAVTDPDKASVHLRSEYMDPYTQSTWSTARQFIQSWAGEEGENAPRQIPNDGNPYYLVSVCPTAAEYRNYELEAQMASRYGDWLSSTRSEGSIGYVVVESDAPSLISELILRPNDLGSVLSSTNLVSRTKTSFQVFQTFPEQIKMRVGASTPLTQGIWVDVQNVVGGDVVLTGASLQFHKESMEKMKRLGMSVDLDTAVGSNWTMADQERRRFVRVKLAEDKRKTERIPGSHQITGRLLITAKPNRPALASWLEKTTGTQYDSLTSDLLTEIPVLILVTGGTVGFQALSTENIDKFLLTEKGPNSTLLVEEVFFPLFRPSHRDGIEHIIGVYSTIPGFLALESAKILAGDGHIKESRGTSLCSHMSVSTLAPARKQTSNKVLRTIGRLRLSYRFPPLDFIESMEHGRQVTCYLQVETKPVTKKYDLPVVLYHGDLSVNTISIETGQTVRQVDIGFDEILKWENMEPDGVAFRTFLRERYGGFTDDTGVLNKYFRDLSLGTDTLNESVRLRPMILRAGVVGAEGAENVPLFLENRNPVPITVSLSTASMHGFSVSLGRDRISRADGHDISDEIARAWPRTKERLEFDTSTTNLDRIHGQRLESIYQFLGKSEVSRRFLDNFRYRDAIYVNRIPARKKGASLARFHKHDITRDTFCNHSESGIHDGDLPSVAMGLLVAHTGHFIDLPACPERKAELVTLPPFGMARMDMTLTAPKENELDRDMSTFVAVGMVITTDQSETIPLFVSFDVPRGHLVLQQSKEWHGLIPSTWRAALQIDSLPALFKSSQPARENVANTRDILDSGLEEAGRLLYAKSTFQGEISLLEIQSCNPWFSVTLFENADDSVLDPVLGSKIGMLQYAIPCSHPDTVPEFYSFSACALNWISKWSELHENGCGEKGIKRFSDLNLNKKRRENIYVVLNRMLQISAWSFSSHYSLSQDNGESNRRPDGYVRPLLVALGEAMSKIWRENENSDMFTMSTDLRATIEYTNVDTGMRQTASLPVQNGTVVSKLVPPSLVDWESLSTGTLPHHFWGNVLNMQPTHVGTAVSMKIPLVNPTAFPVRVRLTALMPGEDTSADLVNGDGDVPDVPGFDVPGSYLPKHPSPYVQGPLYSEQGTGQINQQWWDGPGSFFMANAHGDLVRAHHNVSVRAGSQAYVGLVSPSLSSNSAFLYGCGQRCGIHDEPVKNEAALHVQHQTVLGAAAGSSAVLVGRDRSESVDEGNVDRVSDVFAFSAGGSIHTGGKGPTAFGIPRSALDEIVIPPFGTAEIGPVYFRPPGRNPHMSTVTGTGEASYQNEGAGSSTFSASVYLENSLTGLEQVILHGKALWESVEFLDSPDDSFSDIEIRNGIPSLLFPGTLLPPFPTSLVVLKEFVLNNNGDVPLLFRMAYLSDSITPQEGQKACSIAGFHLLNCTFDETFAPLRLDPGEKYSFIVSHRPGCSKMSEFVSLKLMYDGQDDREEGQIRHTHDPSWRSRRARNRKRSIRRSSETLVIGYDMDSETFSNCVPWNTDMFRPVAEYPAILTPENHTLMIGMLASTVAGLKSSSRPPLPKQALLLLYLCLCWIVVLRVFSCVGGRRVSSHALEEYLRTFAPERNDRLSSFLLWSRSGDDESSLGELKLHCNQLVRNRVLRQLRSTGALQPQCIALDGTFQRDRTHILAAASGLKDKTRTVSETLFHGTTEKSLHSGLLPLNLGWRAAATRGIIHERSFKKIQGHLKTHHLLVSRSRQKAKTLRQLSKVEAGETLEGRAGTNCCLKNDISEIPESEPDSESSDGELRASEIIPNGTSNDNNAELSIREETKPEKLDRVVPTRSESTDSGFKTIRTEKHKVRSRLSPSKKSKPKNDKEHDSNIFERGNRLKFKEVTTEDKPTVPSASSPRLGPVSQTPTSQTRGWAEIAASSAANTEVGLSMPLRLPPGLAPPPGFASTLAPSTDHPTSRARASPENEGFSLNLPVGLSEAQLMDPTQHTHTSSETSSYSSDNIFSPMSPMLGPPHLSRENSMDELPSLSMLLGIGGTPEPPQIVDEPKDDFNVLDFLDGILNDGSNHGTGSETRVDSNPASLLRGTDAAPISLSPQRVLPANPWAEGGETSGVTLYGIPLSESNATEESPVDLPILPPPTDNVEEESNHPSPLLARMYEPR